jgi:nucleoside-diphosphate-sugar epimerase
VDALMLAAEDTAGEPGAIYNVGTGIQTTIGDAVETATRVMSIAGRPVWQTMAARVWDTDTWVANVRKSRNVLGWSARRSFEAGLRLMVDWLAGDPAMRQRYEAAWPRAGSMT